MKRIILAVLFAITLATIIGIFAAYNGPGYVVFSFAEYTIETSFIFALGFIAISFFLLYYLLRVITRVMHFPGYVNKQHVQRQSERSKNALIKGLIEMSEGRFEQAEKILLKQANQSDTSLLNYLMAARAAQQLEEYDRRDEYLRLAHESTPSADIAISLTQAELQLDHQQFEQALATLNHLSTVSPKHSYVKKLQANVYQQLGDWDNLVPLLTEVKKLKVLPPARLDEIEVETYIGMLQSSIKSVDGEKTEQTWRQMPKALKDHADIIRIYANYLISYEKDEEAETLIRNHITANWHDDLAVMYSNLKTSDVKKQLETAETWLHNQPRNATLLMVLGKLSLHCELWGKAKNYFETSISIQAVPEAYLNLAQLMEEKMDDKAEAEKLYQLGLQNAVESHPGSAGPCLTSGDKIFQPQLKLIK